MDGRTVWWWRTRRIGCDRLGGDLDFLERPRAPRWRRVAGAHTAGTLAIVAFWPLFATLDAPLSVWNRSTCRSLAVHRWEGGRQAGVKRNLQQAQPDFTFLVDRRFLRGASPEEPAGRAGGSAGSMVDAMVDSVQDAYIARAKRGCQNVLGQNQCHGISPCCAGQYQFCRQKVTVSKAAVASSPCVRGHKTNEEKWSTEDFCVYTRGKSRL